MGIVSVLLIQPHSCLRRFQIIPIENFFEVIITDYQIL